MSGRAGLEVRAAEAADAGGLIDLLAACGLRAPSARGMAERLAALRGEGASAYLAVAWGPPAGLVVLHRRHALTDEPPAAVLSALLVRPEDRRRGIGRLLLKTAAQAARSAGCHVLELPLSPGLDGTENFALSTGFTPAGAVLARPLLKRGGTA